MLLNCCHTPLKELKCNSLFSGTVRDSVLISTDPYILLLYCTLSLTKAGKFSTKNALSKNIFVDARFENKIKYGIHFYPFYIISKL